MSVVSTLRWSGRARIKRLSTKRSCAVSSQSYDLFPFGDGTRRELLGVEFSPKSVNQALDKTFNLIWFSYERQSAQVSHRDLTMVKKERAR